MECLICRNQVQLLFKSLVLQKYEAEYYQCPHCQFIQTEKPYWLPEAYSSAISSLDVGLVSRNLYFVEVVSPVITRCFDYTASFLDFAGGYGLFVRLMRDKGFDFYRQDHYCENLFAQYLDVVDLQPNRRFELVTAFEVFEHLVDPLPEIAGMFAYSDSVLFSTQLQPNTILNSPKDWWYFVPESGQHVALYSKKSLEIIADKFNCYLYTNYANLHLLTPKKLSDNPFKAASVRGNTSASGILGRLVRKVLGGQEQPKPEPQIHLESLTEKDFMSVKEKITKSQPT